AHAEQAVYCSLEVLDYLMYETSMRSDWPTKAEPWIFDICQKHSRKVMAALKYYEELPRFRLLIHAFKKHTAKSQARMARELKDQRRYDPRPVYERGSLLRKQEEVSKAYSDARALWQEVNELAPGDLEYEFELAHIELNSAFLSSRVEDAISLL